MQLLEFFILPVAVGLDDLRNKEAFERNAVIGKIGRKPAVQRFGKRGQMLVDFENTDCIILHVLRDIGFDTRHKECTEEGYQLLLTEAIFRPDQLQKQLSAVFRTERHFAGGTDGYREPVARLYISHLAVRSPFHRHLLGFVDKVNLAVERCFIARCTVKHLPDLRDILCFESITAGAEQIQCLTVHEEYRFLRFVNDQLCQAVKILTGVLPDKC